MYNIKTHGATIKTIKKTNKRADNTTVPNLVCLHYLVTNKLRGLN